MFWFADDWGQFGRTYERIAEHLAKLPEINHVACMFPPVSARHSGLQRALRIDQVSAKLTLVTETDYEGFWLFAPLPRIRRYLNGVSRSRQLLSQLRRRGFRRDNTVLWLFPPHPYLEHLLETVPHRHVISQVQDDFTKIDPEHWLYSVAKTQYPKLAQWSDTIITTSEANRARFSEMGRSCHLFGPAVDESFLGQPAPLPYRTTGQPPRVGYLGWIMERTDLDLMQYVARKRPSWRLILAGPQNPDGYLDRSALLALPNVEYLGPIPQRDAPEFLWSLDVCLMPHRDNEYSRSMGPLKLYQYLASGRPVVSTNVAGLEPVREHIRVASDPDEFVLQIESALQTDTVARSADRIRTARQNTWSIRVREMVDALRISG